jgi:hypothetical protein
MKLKGYNANYRDVVPFGAGEANAGEAVGNKM